MRRARQPCAQCLIQVASWPFRPNPSPAEARTLLNSRRCAVQSTRRKRALPGSASSSDVSRGTSRCHESPASGRSATIGRATSPASSFRGVVRTIESDGRRVRRRGRASRFPRAVESLHSMITVPVDHIADSGDSCGRTPGRLLTPVDGMVLLRGRHTQARRCCRRIGDCDVDRCGRCWCVACVDGAMGSAA